MKISEMLTEEQVNELGLADIGRGINAVGRGAAMAGRGIGKTVGAVAGGVHGAVNAVKQGYQAGKYNVGDRRISQIPGRQKNVRPATAPAQAPRAATTQQSVLPQLVTAISKLSPRDLQKLKQAVDNIAAKSPVQAPLKVAGTNP